MTINHVIFSYKLSLVEVGIIALMVFMGAIPAGFSMIVASAIAGLAYSRELAWIQKSG